MHVDLICPYINDIRQYKPVSDIIEINFSLAYMKIIDPVMGWLEIDEVLIYILDEVTSCNY